MGRVTIPALLWRITYKNRFVIRSLSSKLWTLFEKGNRCFKIVWKNFYLIPHQPFLPVCILHHEDIFILHLQKNTSLCILFLIFQFNCFHCFLFRIKIDKTVDSFLVTNIISKEHVSRLMKDSNPKFPSKYSSRISTSLLIYASSLLW